MLGEPVTVTIETAPGAKLDLQATATSYFAVTASAEEKPGLWKLEIVPLDLGKRDVVLRFDRGEASFLLDIQEPPSAAGAPELRDIKGPRRARPALGPWLLAAAAAAGLYFLWKRRRPAGAGAAAAPVETRPAEAVAEAELSALEASGLWEEGRHKEFYLRLTEIARRYLERRYGVPATRLTTSELARALRRLELERALSAVFKDLLDRADLVKFAKVRAEPGWGAADLASARRLVRETTPAPAPAEAAR